MQKSQQYTYIALSLPKCKQQSGNSAKQADPHHPLICLYPVLVARREEADSAQASCEEDLDGKDGVDLANELHSDGQCCFGNRSAKLLSVNMCYLMLPRYPRSP
jgi:hypothetical protein